MPVNLKAQWRVPCASAWAVRILTTVSASRRRCLEQSSSHPSFITQSKLFGWSLPSPFSVLLLLSWCEV